jgi:heme oxygenase
MNNLRELTLEKHKSAERSKFAGQLIRGLSPEKYYEYLLNQYEIYFVLEKAADKILEEYPDIKRSEKIQEDILELEKTYGFSKEQYCLKQTVENYKNYVSTIGDEQLLAHLYVRHFGDMYGGQIIRKKTPGSGKMYDFDNVEQLKIQLRSALNDSMAEEANICFDFALDLFKELE